jgi:hypothetical protein
MNRYVEISFDCVPLRSLGRFDIPLDVPQEQAELYKRIRLAVEKQGVHNAYYLCHARCVFHLTNDPAVGVLDFAFEGTVLTDPEDRRTLGCDLVVSLRGETCPWLTAAVSNWFAETVREAVRVEFDRYIAAGDLAKAVERAARLEAESDAQSGFLGMGL